MLSPKNSLKLAAILMCICMSFSCGSNNRSVKVDFTEDPIVAYNKIRSLLMTGHDEEDPFLYSKWTEYVKKILMCDNNDYLQALEQISLKYMDEIVRAGECTRINSRSEENHSSKWLDELVAHYGLSFVRESRDLILTNIRLSIAHEHSECEDNYGRILYQEALLYAAYKQYLNTFLEFYDTLDKKEKAFFKSRQEASTLFLGLIDELSYAPVVTAGGPRRIVYKIFTKRENEELYNFMEAYISSQNFHPMKASREFTNRIDQNQ